MVEGDQFWGGGGRVLSFDMGMGGGMGNREATSASMRGEVSLGELWEMNYAF